MDEVLMVAMQAFELIRTVMALQGLLLQELSMKHPGYHMSTSIYRVEWDLADFPLADHMYLLQLHHT